MTVRDPPETGSVEKKGQDNELDREPGRRKPGEWAVWLTVLGRCIELYESKGVARYGKNTKGLFLKV